MVMSAQSEPTQSDLFPVSEPAQPEAAASEQNVASHPRRTAAKKKPAHKLGQPGVAAARPKEPEGSRPEERFLSDRQVARRYDVSRATVWRWRKSNPNFPAPKEVSDGTTRWRLSELLVFEDRMPAKFAKRDDGAKTSVDTEGE